MCGNGESIYGIISGLAAAAAILIMAFAEKHGGAHEHALPHAGAVHAVQNVAPVRLELRCARTVLRAQSGLQSGI
jgi:hypothetical protein